MLYIFINKFLLIFLFFNIFYLIKSMFYVYILNILINVWRDVYNHFPVAKEKSHFNINMFCILKLYINFVKISIRSWIGHSMNDKTLERNQCANFFSGETGR